MAEIKHPVLERIREKTRQEKKYKLRFLWLKYWFKKYNISMKKETKREIFWIAVMILFLFIFFLTGCGTKKTVTEKFVKEIDSTAVVSLQTELFVKNKIIENLQTDLERTREENTRLLSESSSHTINYDTNAPVNPETGEYPKASETKTESKYLVEKTLKDMETLKQEHRKEVETLETLNSNLELTVEMLKQENSDLKTKSVPGFNLKSFLWGMMTGAALLILLLLFLKR